MKNTNRLSRGIVIEGLEDRQLLSATLHPATASSALIASPPIVMPVNSTIRSYSQTLSLTAGQGFDNYLGVLVGYTPVFEKGLVFSASVNWGDGTSPTAGIVTIESSGKIDVGGSHTYAKAGTYWYSITVTGAPKVIPGQPTPMFILLAGTINGKANVAAVGGVTLSETRQTPFTASVGTFVTPAPGTNLTASINWGDGTTSKGTVNSIGVVGLDEILFEVDGTHTYTNGGLHPITVTVVRSLAGQTTTIATISSLALVNWNNPSDLNGTITGTYKLAPPIPGDAGESYLFTGSGQAGVVGAVTVAGTVNLPGFVTSGQASGTLTLTNSAKTGTITLSLTGPTEAGFGPFPSSLSYTVTGGTGIYGGAVGSGTIGVTLDSSTMKFTFNISTFLPPST